MMLYALLHAPRISGRRMMFASRYIADSISLLIVSFIICRSSPADEWFVDNRDGDDIFDGRLAAPVNERSGPVKAIGSALKRVRPGDTVIVADHGVPYFESLEMVGPRFVGVT